MNQNQRNHAMASFFEELTEIKKEAVAGTVARGAGFLARLAGHGAKPGLSMAERALGAEGKKGFGHYIAETYRRGANPVSGSGVTFRAAKKSRKLGLAPSAKLPRGGVVGGLKALGKTDLGAGAGVAGGTLLAGAGLARLASGPRYPRAGGMY